MVANRGEIAIRILRAASELGIRTVAIYSHEDRFALYRFKADEAYKIGNEGDPIGTYLDAKNIVDMAKQWGVDAIHPGYGFLSESAEFARLCTEAGVEFVGPKAEILESFGDKVTARKMAKLASLPLIPGTQSPLADLEEARKVAGQLGYPVTLKAVSGGGGKGIRMIASEDELAQAYERASSEAQTSFGRADLYLEKKITGPKHIEVQILGDSHGNLVHLYERDCSIQRRHQKIVELAPALGLKPSTREAICQMALKLGRHVKYNGLGTVEFLVSDNDEIYFLEVNPRIQVEHTVTEMITGIDLVQASILVAAGVPLDSERIGIPNQESVVCRGAAIQCRITTEDPLNQFAPDTGKIIAYRPATGFGIRLDEGHGTSGGVVTPHYDSLLVKVTAWARDLESAASKMHRSLSEFRIRGIKHNIPLLKNVVRHSDFLASKMTTEFLDQHDNLYKFVPPRDRATKILRYIAEVTVNNPHDLPVKRPPGERDSPSVSIERPDLAAFSKEGAHPTARQVWKSDGDAGLKKWIKDHQGLLLTDTTMRDAHQSLFATRLRTRDILNIAPFYEKYAHQFFSLEVWGGATFDSCLRFLKEDPWKRLSEIRESIPNVMLQMLLRGDNAVGYANYPAWVVRDFISEATSAGLDIFRVFDCFNQPAKMENAVNAVKKCGGLAEVSLCYTGNVIDPKEAKYTLDYYIEVARHLVEMGADILCIKDMAGLLRPQAAKVLVEALKGTFDVPIHLHMHDTSGVGVTTLMEAAQAGCEIVDGAVSSMSGLTSQPSLNALVAVMQGGEHCPSVPLPVLDDLAKYWETVRGMYRDFDPGIRSTSTAVYQHEIPGGQYSNLFQQAMSVGVSTDEFYELTERYSAVNKLFGNLIKVTPSSKVVGDMALLLQKKGVSVEELIEGDVDLDYPDSVVSFFSGRMGQPYGGFPTEVQQKVLGSSGGSTATKNTDEETDDYASCKVELESQLDRVVSKSEILSYRLYPKVFAEFNAHREQFGNVDGLSTSVYFYGLEQGDEIETDLEPGKTLIIELAGISEPNEAGVRQLFFKLNGYSRTIEVTDRSVTSSKTLRPKISGSSPSEIGAAMPGKVLSVNVKVGAEVEKGQALLVTESMKMEYVVSAKSSGKVEEITVNPGDMVEGNDLLVRINPEG